MKHITEAEIRLFIEEPAEGIFRANMLELPLFAVCSSPMGAVNCCYEQVVEAIRHGDPFRLGDAIPAHLLRAYDEANLDEQVAEASGVVWTGPIARAVHVIVETDQQLQPA